MSSKNIGFIVHPAKGGLDTTRAPSLLEPDQLTIADNIEYFTSGARRKRLGTARYNSSTLGAAVVVTALADHWRFGTSLTPVQKFVAAANTIIVKDDNDGIWDTLTTGWGTSSAIVDVVIAQGYSVFANNVGNAPQKYDHTTISNLTSDGTPRFAASTYHLRRLFTVGEQTAVGGGTANPSRTTISAAADITDFLSGGDATSFILDDDDGDRLIGISQPYRNRLYYFKGPNFGSVHELTGTTKSTFAVNKVAQGAPCIAHDSIITTPNDIYWVSRYGIHSLQSTQKYGDTEQSFISRDIQTDFNNLNFGQLARTRGFWHPTRNIVGWFVPGGGQSTNNLCLVYNYVLELWAIWYHEGFDVASCAVMIDPAGTGQGQPRLYMGSYGGFVYEGDQTVQSDDNALTAYTAKIQTPRYTRFNEAATELHEKVFYSITTFFKPKGSYTVNLDVMVDKRSQSYTVSVAGGGSVLDTGQLDSGPNSPFILGGGEFEYAETPINDRGRSIQLTWTQSGANQDMEIYGHAIRAQVAESHALESS
jgi:hypothetical protein